MKVHIEKHLNNLSRWLTWSSILCLIAIVFVVSLQILARYVLPKAPIWTEELTRYLFIYMIVFASSQVMVERRHIRIDFIQEKFNLTQQKVLNQLIYFSIFIFSCLLLKHAYIYSALGEYQTSPTLGLKMSLIFSSTILFFSISSLTSLGMLLVETFTQPTTEKV